MGEPRARIERSAGGVVVRRIDGEGHVLLIRDPYDNWGLPKGHLEEREEPRDAAVREVAEDDFFLMTSEEGLPVPDESEGITACRWVPISRALRDLGYRNARQVVEGARGVLEGGWEGAGAASDG